MNELQNRCLDTFPEWLRTLAADANELAKVLASTSAPEATRRYVAGGLNYLFKSLDLIPDGIEDLGFLDDAFVIRVAAALALHEAPASREDAVLARLAGESKLIAELLKKTTKASAATFLAARCAEVASFVPATLHASLIRHAGYGRGPGAAGRAGISAPRRGKTAHHHVS